MKTKNQNTIKILLIGTLILGMGGFLLSAKPVLAAAGINKQINFQGKVVNTDGTNVSTASYTFLFCLYTTATPTTACTSGADNDAVWRESKSLTVTDGIFQTNLGDTTTLPGSVDFNTDNIYLGINFNANGQMTPLVRFTAAPYAMNADKVGGLGTPDLIVKAATANQTVTSTQTSGTVFGITDTTAISAATKGLSITLSGSGAFDQTGLEFNLSGASGTNLNDIVGSGSTWKVSKGGATTFSSVVSSGAIAANGGITFDQSTDTVGSFTSNGTILMNTNILQDIGNTGTDFIASTGALTLAGVLTANGGISLSGSQSLTAAALAYVDLGLITHSTTANQGLRLPNAASATPSNPTSGEGYLAWDAAGNQLITYNGASWTTVGGGGGANTALSNLSGVAINTDLIGAVAGGMGIRGGSAANDDLILEGTTNATRTTSYVILQPNGGNVGIGTASPSQALTISASDSGDGGVLSAQNTLDAAYVGVFNALAPNLSSGNRAQFRVGKSTTTNGAAEFNFLYDSGGNSRFTLGMYNNDDIISYTYAGQVQIGATAIVANPSTLYLGNLKTGAGSAQYVGNWPGAAFWGIGPATGNGDNTVRLGNTDNAAGTWSGTQDLTLLVGGKVGIGDTTPDGKLDVEPTGAVTTASYGINLSNLTTNATTNAINKYGAYITSTGTWTGAGGTATNNYGLYVDTVSGGDNNYGAYIAGNVDTDGTLTAGSGNIALTNATGNILHDALVACADTEILKYATAGAWGCAASGGGGDLQTSYGLDADGGNATISLTAADDGLIFTNPTSGGNDLSAFTLQISQLNTTAAITTLDLVQASNAANGVDITANAIDAESAMTITANALINGVALNISGGGATALTTGSILRVTGPTGAAAIATNGVAQITAAGAFTGTGGLLNVAGNVTTAGTLMNISADALTTGIALNIDNSTSAMTTGSLLRVVAGGTGAINTNGIVSISHSGNYTSTSNNALLNVVANATTAGTVQKISGTGLTTGSGLIIVGGTAMTTGSDLDVNGATYLHTGSETGSLVDIAFTDGTTAVVTSTTNGILVTPTISAASGAATRTINGISVEPAFTNCAAGTCAVNGLNIKDVTDGTGFTGTAINIGTGWDTGISLGTNTIAATGSFSINMVNGSDDTLSLINSGAGTAKLKIDSLTNGGAGCDTIDTTADGTLICGTDAGAGASPFASASGVITKSTAGDYISLRYGDAGDVQLQIENTTGAVVPTADTMSIDVTGGTTGIVTAGVDVLAINWEAGHMSAGGTINGINLALTPISASTTSADLFNGLNIGNITGTSATESAIKVGTGWDNAISGNGFSISGTGALTVASCVGCGGSTTKSVASDHTNATTTATNVTDLNTTLAAGTYVFKYTIMDTTTLAGTSPAYGVNFTGTDTAHKMTLLYPSTGTTAISGTADDVGATSGQIYEHVTVAAYTTTAANMLETGGQTVTNVVLKAIEGIIVVTVSGDLQLYHGSETANSTSLKAGSSLVVTKIGAGSDLAELYGTKDASIEPGDVVAFDASLKAGVKKSEKAYDANVFGIISTSPSLMMGTLDDPGTSPVMVAFSGRVPVKVTTENGPIKFGDLLTASSTPGVAMRATKAGQVIGQAMSEFNGEGVGKVMAFIKTDYSNGAKLADILPSGLSATGSAATEAQKDRDRQALAYFMEHKEALVTATDLSEISTDRVMAGLEIITPKVTTQELAADVITPSLTNTLAIQLGPDGSVTFGEAGKEPTSKIDALGNATFAGTLTAKTIRADTIEGLEIYTDSVKSLEEKYAGLVPSSFVAANATAPLVPPTAETTADVSSQTLEKLSTKNLAVTLDAAILGKLSVSGALRIGGDAEFSGETIFQKLATFFGDTLFKGKVMFAKAPIFSNDTAGFAVIGEGQKSVEIVFDEKYVKQPIVSVSLTSDQSPLLDGADKDLKNDIQAVEDDFNAAYFDGDIKYLVTKKSEQGFTILLNKKAPHELQFSWVALAVKGAKTSYSKDMENDISETEGVSQSVSVPQEPSSSQSSEPTIAEPIGEAVPASIVPLTTETGVTTDDTTDEAVSSLPAETSQADANVTAVEDSLSQ